MERLNVILSPHFDDAVLSLGGLLAQEGSQTIVATFFAGTPSKPLTRPWDLISGFRNSDEAMRGRAMENHDALCTLGVADQNIINLHNLDLQYRGWKSYFGFKEANLEATVRNQIDSLLQRYPKFEVRIYGPGLEIHKDHGLLKKALLKVFNSGQYPAPEYFLYQDLPYAYYLLKKQAPLTKVEDLKYAQLEQEITKGEFKVQVRAVSLTSDDMRKKTESFSLYKSQMRPMGGNVCQTLRDFAHSQSKFLQLNSHYCEVVYKLVK